MTKEEMINKTWDALKEIGLPVVSVTCGAKQQAKQQVVVNFGDIRKNNQDLISEKINKITANQPENAMLKITTNQYGFTTIRLYFQY